MSGFWCKKPDDWNFNRFFFSKCKVVDFDPNQNCSHKETPIGWTKSIIFGNNFLENLDYQDFVARIKFDDFSIECFCTEVKVLIEILIDELKPGVDETIQFKCSVLSIMMAYSEFLDGENCDARHKTIEFSM